MMSADSEFATDNFAMPDSWYEPPEYDGYCVACGDYAADNFGTMSAPLCMGCAVPPPPPKVSPGLAQFTKDFIRERYGDDAYTLLLP